MLLEVGSGRADNKASEDIAQIVVTDAGTPVGLRVEHVLLLVLNGREEVDHVLRRLGTWALSR